VLTVFDEVDVVELELELVKLVLSVFDEDEFVDWVDKVKVLKLKLDLVLEDNVVDDVDFEVEVEDDKVVLVDFVLLLRICELVLDDVDVDDVFVDLEN
jgi:hypothetical protein